MERKRRRIYSVSVDIDRNVDGGAVKQGSRYLAELGLAMPDYVHSGEASCEPGCV